MRYKLLEDGDKFKRLSGQYYAVGLDGTEGLVNREWVRSNINYISNASISGSSIYRIADQYDKAILILYNHIKRELYLSSNGLNLTNELSLFNIKRQDIMIKGKLNNAATIVDIFHKLKTYNIDTSKIYNECLLRAVKPIYNNDEEIFAVYDKPNKLHLFKSKEKAESYRQREGGGIVSFESIVQFQEYICKLNMQIK